MQITFCMSKSQQREKHTSVVVPSLEVYMCQHRNIQDLISVAPVAR